MIPMFWCYNILAKTIELRVCISINRLHTCIHILPLISFDPVACQYDKWNEGKDMIDFIKNIIILFLPNVMGGMVN